MMMDASMSLDLASVVKLVAPWQTVANCHWQFIKGGLLWMLPKAVMMCFYCRILAFFCIHHMTLITLDHVGFAPVTVLIPYCDYCKYPDRFPWDACCLHCCSLFYAFASITFWTEATVRQPFFFFLFRFESWSIFSDIQPRFFCLLY